MIVVVAAVCGAGDLSGNAPRIQGGQSGRCEEERVRRTDELYSLL